MLAPAILGGGFLENLHGQFDPLSYFFGAGLATNIGAAVLGLILGFLWGRAKLKGLHARHEQHTQHLDRLGKSLVELHSKLDALSDARSGPGGR